jgi:hypothetical protein
MRHRTVGGARDGAMVTYRCKSDARYFSATMRARGRAQTPGTLGQTATNHCASTLDAASRRGETLSVAEQPPTHSVLVSQTQTRERQTREEVVRTRLVGPNV